MAEGDGRYNPIGYHVGTVWPFDNSFIAWGLRRYGFKDEAAQIAAGILAAAEFFEGRDAYFADPEGNYWETAWSARDNPVTAAARRAAGITTDVQAE